MSREPIDLSYAIASPCETTPEDLFITFQNEQTKVSFASVAARDNFYAFLSLALDQIDNKSKHFSSSFSCSPFLP
jgi:hypothetical protein